MCLFTNLGYWPTVLRIWDFFFVEEAGLNVFRFALAILKNCEIELLNLNSLEIIVPFLHKLSIEKLNINTLIQLGRSMNVNAIHQNAVKAINEKEQHEMLNLLENKSPILKRKLPSNAQDINSLESKTKKPSLWNSLVSMIPKYPSPQQSSIGPFSLGRKPKKNSPRTKQKILNLNLKFAQDKENINNFVFTEPKLSSPNSDQETFISLYAEDFHQFTASKNLSSPKKNTSALKTPTESTQFIQIKQIELKTFNEIEEN